MKTLILVDRGSTLINTNGTVILVPSKNRKREDTKVERLKGNYCIAKSFRNTAEHVRKNENT